MLLILGFVLTAELIDCYKKVQWMNEQNDNRQIVQIVPPDINKGDLNEDDDCMLEELDNYDVIQLMSADIQYNNILTQKGFIYRAALEIGNVKVKSASQLFLKNELEELLKCSKEAWRVDKTQ